MSMPMLPITDAAVTPSMPRMFPLILSQLSLGRTKFREDLSIQCPPLCLRLHLRRKDRQTRSPWNPYQTKNRMRQHPPSCWTLPLGGLPISSDRCHSRSRRRTKRGSFGGLRFVSCGRRDMAEEAVLLPALSRNTTAMRSFTATPNMTMSHPTIAHCALKKARRRQKRNVIAGEDTTPIMVSTQKKTTGGAEPQPNSRKQSLRSIFPTKPTQSFPPSWQSHGMSGRRPTRPTFTEIGRHSTRWNRTMNTSPGSFRSWTKYNRGWPSGSWQGSVSGGVHSTRACGGYKISTWTLPVPILKPKPAPIV
mmetsp:Transcript_25315/g.73268  ORF Transcript_25315/g.73268 Transcript_25315/m.73268 type:complete len:306 (-) Transcript_25315:3181-4098(-)